MATAGASSVVIARFVAAFVARVLPFDFDRSVDALDGAFPVRFGVAAAVLDEVVMVRVAGSGKRI